MINEMYENRLRDRKSKEVHIYQEHFVNEPELIDISNVPEIFEVKCDVNEESSDDDYESAEDEAYEPPHASVEDEFEEDDMVVKASRKKKPGPEPQPKPQLLSKLNLRKLRKRRKHH